MIQNHSTWKYGWQAKTSCNQELMGTVMFPVTGMKINKESEEVLTDPTGVAWELAAKNAQFSLDCGKEMNKFDKEATIVGLTIWEMADNRIR